MIVFRLELFCTFLGMTTQNFNCSLQQETKFELLVPTEMGVVVVVGGKERSNFITKRKVFLCS